MSQHHSHVRLASDGTPLHFLHWKSQETPRGWVLVLHGIQSHSVWYEYSSQKLAEVGFDVRVPDRRGSGKSDGPRGHAGHWERLVNDVRHFLQDIQTQKERSGVRGPVILVGISWGAKLAMAVARLSPALLDGLILITPGLFPRFEPNWFDRLRLNVARQLGIVHKRIPIPFNDAEFFTSVPQWQKFIREDPLTLRDITVGLLLATQDLDKIARSPAPFSLPLHLMLAERDRITDNEKTRTFFDRITNGRSGFIEYSNAWHTLELDVCREQFVNDLIGLASNISTASGHRSS